MALITERSEFGLGAVLTTWRAHAGFDQQQVAARLQPASSVGALSTWERDRRRPSWERIAELDDVYGAGGALVDLAGALDSPVGLPSRRVWSHNFRSEPGPVWAWLRPETPGVLQAVLRWGAFGIDLRHECTRRGVLVCVPTSFTNPAGWVILREPGWVDFGRGRPPTELGIPIIEALDHASVTDLPHSVAGLVSRALSERYRSDAAFATEVQQLFGARPDLVDRVFNTTTGWRQILDVGPAPAAAARSGAAGMPAGFSGSQYAALRAARHLSLRQAAEAATTLDPTAPVSDDHVRRLEAGSAPRVERLRSRLDMVYPRRRSDLRRDDRDTPRRDDGALDPRLPRLLGRPCLAPGRRACRHHVRRRARVGRRLRAAARARRSRAHLPPGVPWRATGQPVAGTELDGVGGWGRGPRARRRRELGVVQHRW